MNLLENLDADFVCVSSESLHRKEVLAYVQGHSFRPKGMVEIARVGGLLRES